MRLLGAALLALTVTLLSPTVAAEPAGHGAAGLFGDPAARPISPAAVPNWHALQSAERAWMARAALPDLLSSQEGEALRRGLDLVNRHINRKPYVGDQAAAGGRNSWAAPPDFFAQGGDCEDYAVAKYFALRALGMRAEIMRVVVIHDRRRDLDHAILLVREGDEALVLDNLRDDIVSWRTVGHYQPVYSVNEIGAWLHSGVR